MKIKRNKNQSNVKQNNAGYAYQEDKNHERWSWDSRGDTDTRAAQTREGCTITTNDEFTKGTKSETKQTSGEVNEHKHIVEYLTGTEKWEP